MLASTTELLRRDTLWLAISIVWFFVLLRILIFVLFA
jgi:hypothetical protein